MGAIKSLNKWANRHSYYAIDLVRVALGVFLFMKGVSFMEDSQYFSQMVAPLREMAGSIAGIHYVAAAHFMGGVLIAFGLLTRWAIIAQIPILIGAIAINFLGEMNTTNLITASAVFIICIFFLFYGSGKHSCDYYFKMQK